jgi:protein involved in polysaccharide export with SLBB domain
MRRFLMVLLGIAVIGCAQRKNAALDEPVELLVGVGSSGTVIRANCKPITDLYGVNVSNTYIIQRGDRLEIGVWGEDDMTKRLTVGTDGKISYFMARNMQAAGKTPRELARSLLSSVKKYFGPPQFWVRLIDTAGDFVSISGAIDCPGLQPIDIHTRLLTVLRRAQVSCVRPKCPRRTGERPDWSQAFVLRGTKFLDVDLEKLLGAKGATPREIAVNDVLLQPSDRIYVPTLIKSGNKVYVVGATRQPRLIRYSKEITYLEALITSGDAPEAAWKRKSFIIRGKMKHPQIIPVNARLVRTGKLPDIALKPGDTVFIPRMPIKKTSEVIRQLDVIYRQVARAEAAWKTRFDR